MSRLVVFLGCVVMTLSLATPVEGSPSETGSDLFQRACASCHGVDGAGAVGPSLVGVGAAAADFQLTTGRMPMAEVRQQATRKPPAFSPDQIAELIAFVASLGNGPPIPDVQPEGGDVAAGGRLFRSDCAACHGAAGTGTALGYGRYAPDLYQATATQIGEAVRSGPGNMPVFSDDQLSATDLDSIAAYIGWLQEHHDPGGASLGRIGPIPEGMVGWLVGIAGLIAAAVWIERRAV